MSQPLAEFGLHYSGMAIVFQSANIISFHCSRLILKVKLLNPYLVVLHQ